MAWSQGSSSETPPRWQATMYIDNIYMLEKNLVWNGGQKLTTCVESCGHKMGVTFVRDDITISQCYFNLNVLERRGGCYDSFKITISYIYARKEFGVEWGPKIDNLCGIVWTQNGGDICKGRHHNFTMLFQPKRFRKEGRVLRLI